MKVLIEKRTAVELPAAVRAGTGEQNLAGLVTGLSRFLDRIAGICLAGVMLLVVVNIILRVVFNRPILGTIEYVGFFTAVVIGLSLAYCAVQNAHIAVNFVADKLPVKVQAVFDTVVNTLALGFWGLASWHLWKYGQSLAASGVVSSTTQTPYYPFVYLVAAGLFALCLVLLVKLIESVKRTAVNR